MSLPALTLRAVELEFYGIPETLSEAEQHRVKALTAINYLGNLGRIISLLSASKIAEPGQGKESRPLKTRPHSAPTGAAFGFCYAPPLARDSESTND